MAAPLKSPEAKMEFLMTIIASFDGKIDWNKVALASGLHKNGTGYYQAYRNVLKMYGRKPDSVTVSYQTTTEAGKQAKNRKRNANRDSLDLVPEMKRTKTEPDEKEVAIQGEEK